MTILLDTSVAIPVRDGDPAVLSRLAKLEETLAVSIVTVVELQGGLAMDDSAVRRARLDLLLRELRVLAFGQREAAAYGGIVMKAGYSRRKVLDRMIAAQAMTAGATLVTLNPGDFRDIEGLAVEGW